MFALNVTAKCILTCIYNIQKPIIVLILLIQRGHEYALDRNMVSNEYEYRLLGRQLHASPNHVYELSQCEGRRRQKFVFIELFDI